MTAVVDDRRDGVELGGPGAGHGLRPARAVLIALLKAYRLTISPLYGNVCKFYPSCSAYALHAVEVHGAARGSWLAARRLGRCHPWSHGGYDPVPGTPEHAAECAERAARQAARSEQTSVVEGARPVDGRGAPEASGPASTQGEQDPQAALARPTLEFTAGAVGADPQSSPRGGQ